MPNEYNTLCERTSHRSDNVSKYISYKANAIAIVRDWKERYNIHIT